MSIRTILQYPDPRLKAVAQPVSPEQDLASLATLIDDMIETMYAAPGVGLAATQIGVLSRIVVMDCDERGLLELVNPVVVERSGTQREIAEGCLSVGGGIVSGFVDRAAFVRVEAFNRDLTPFTMTAQDLLSVCVQHELDHLDGVLFIDRMTPLARKHALKKK
jgi:peptide deformylase